MWTQLTRMAKEMERADATPAQEGRGDTAVTARQATPRVAGALTRECSKQENFWEAQGRKE